MEYKAQVEVRLPSIRTCMLEVGHSTNMHVGSWTFNKHACWKLDIQRTCMLEVGHSTNIHVGSWTFNEHACWKLDIQRTCMLEVGHSTNMHVGSWTFNEHACWKLDIQRDVGQQQNNGAFLASISTPIQITDVNKVIYSV